MEYHDPPPQVDTATAAKHTFSLFRLSRLQGVGPLLQIIEPGVPIRYVRSHANNGCRVKIRNVVDFGSRLDLQVGCRVHHVQDRTLKLGGQKAGR